MLPIPARQIIAAWARTNNYIITKAWWVITHPFQNLNSGLGGGGVFMFHREEVGVHGIVANIFGPCFIRALFAAANSFYLFTQWQLNNLLKNVHFVKKMYTFQELSWTQYGHHSVNQTNIFFRFIPTTICYILSLGYNGNWIKNVDNSSSELNCHLSPYRQYMVTLHFPHYLFCRRWEYHWRTTNFLFPLEQFNPTEKRNVIPVMGITLAQPCSTFLAQYS